MCRLFYLHVVVVVINKRVILLYNSRIALQKSRGMSYVVNCAAESEQRYFGVVLFPAAGQTMWLEPCKLFLERFGIGFIHIVFPFHFRLLSCL